MAMPPLSVPLSVLDLAPVGEGSTPAQALRNSIELVRVVERVVSGGPPGADDEGSPPETS